MPRPDWFDAPECDTHEKGAPRFCKRSEPGEGTERSCAFDGARVVLMPITDAIHLVHGPIACAGNSWDNRGARSSGSQLYRRGFTTEVLHNDVVFGGEGKLRRAILDLSARYAGEARAIFVYATCVTAMTGDDVEAVCKAVSAEVPIPVIPVNTPGFVGDKNIGNRLAGELLLEHVIGTAEPEVRTDHDVNLIGEYNIAGDLWGMLPLFERLGIRILSCISGDARFDDLRYAHRARLNVIVCSKSLTNLAKKMRKRWGIPYLEESFYGLTDTARALRDIARELDALRGPDEHGMRDRVEALVAEEEARCRSRIAPHRARLAGKRAVLFTGGVKTWSMVNALRELGVEVLAAGTQNSTLEDFHRMKALLHRDARIIEDTSTKGLLGVVREKLPDLIVAGGKTKFFALKTRTPFLDINHGRSFPYAGYEGMVTFARQLDLTVNSPIWPALSSAAPWDRPAEARAAALLAELEIADKADQLPGELSRGMKQKLVIACGLLHSPQVMYFDEPLTGLDPLGIRRMKDTIRRLAREEGAAIILSSHLLSLLEEVCTHVLIMKQGRRIAVGTLPEVVAQFSHGEPDVSLEEVFIRATGNSEA